MVDKSQKPCVQIFQSRDGYNSVVRYNYLYFLSGLVVTQNMRIYLPVKMEKK